MSVSGGGASVGEDAGSYTERHHTTEGARCPRLLPARLLLLPTRSCGPSSWA